MFKDEQNTSNLMINENGIYVEKLVLHRDFENVRKKIVNAIWSIVFNKTCIENIYKSFKLRKN